MSTALDPMRRWLGLGSSQSSQRDISESPVAGPEATDAVDGLHYRTRRALGIATVVAGGVAMSHQPLADALAVTHGLVYWAQDMLCWCGRPRWPSLSSLVLAPSSC